MGSVVFGVGFDEMGEIDERPQTHDLPEAGRWNWASIAAAILLACYLGLAIWALAAPSEYDPQQGMAIGFIIPVALVLGGLLLLLWRAVVRGRRWLVWTIFVLAAYPAVMRVAQFVYEHFFRTPG